MSGELEGRTVLLTGSNRGIGHALLNRLAVERVRLLAGVRELDRYSPPEVDGSIAADIEPLRVDLSSRESIESIDGLDEIDVLINNAGEFVGGTVEQLDVDAIYSTIQANLTGLIHLTRLVLPGMLERGHGKIVNQASIISHLDFPGTGVYAATKAGVATFTHCLRRELEDSGVTTLEVITGGYDTDMLRKAAEQLEPHTDPSSWEWQDPAEWADEIVEAIVSDEEQLKPSGKSRLGMLVPDAVLDAVAKRAFDR
jgi:short-subunit dehydrogenase